MSLQIGQIQDIIGVKTIIDQTCIYYAMPVRNIKHTSTNYSVAQADEARRSYKKGSITTDGDEVRILLTQEEFLSGFRKSDKLSSDRQRGDLPWCGDVEWPDYASWDAE